MKWLKRVFVDNWRTTAAAVICVGGEVTKAIAPEHAAICDTVKTVAIISGMLSATDSKLMDQVAGQVKGIIGTVKNPPK
jgi:hypothetical protein